MQSAKLEELDGIRKVVVRFNEGRSSHGYGSCDSHSYDS